jgi:dTDP-L-rhamnose 4-epimerase
MEKVLVTGGLGFIGSHVVDLLVEKGYEVKVLDNLEPQVHGNNELPEYFNRNVVLVKGDVRDYELFKEAIEDSDAVIHLAATVGVGQSMYQITKYVSYNTLGTANLLDIIVNEKNNIKKLIVASSMSVYGEGKYYCEKCGYVYPKLRSEEQLRKREWELRCPFCNDEITPVPTDENKPLNPTSIYAQTKRCQEEMVLLIGKTYGIPSVALRFFNVYGPRQSLRNPYTGVAAIFLSRLLNNKPPYIFEDGNQTRDFIHVKDVARATVLVLEKSNVDYMPVNIGTGKAVSILSIVEFLAELLNLKVKSIISNRYRKGDVRHCYADISRAKNLLDYEPRIDIKEGLKELIIWAKEHHWEAADLFEKAIKELEERKLT